jgi:hypothetical protein
LNRSARRMLPQIMEGMFIVVVSGVALVGCDLD